MPRPRYLILTTGLIVIAVFGTGCTPLLFQPLREHRFDPAQAGIVYEEEWFESEDGVRLHGWFLPAPHEPHGAVLFLHGNAENISTHINSVWWLPQAGYDVLLFDYRGYGKSEGQATLAGLHLDAQAALRRLLAREAERTDRIAVFGQSLGAAIAVSMLARAPESRRVRALAVEGIFPEYRAIARDKMAGFWLTAPFNRLLAYTFDNRFKPGEDITRLPRLPLLVIAGTHDPIVPAVYGRRFHAMAPQPKTYWEIPHIPHIGAFLAPARRARFVRWLEEAMAE
ncbi:MAG TPA: alpha/beta hydrolase [Gammaproteobacteria bacterium]|nr:alpha/beta hydrolase [Gammaproteobacteria bacterium]